jgi:hypothetical protein
MAGKELVLVFGAVSSPLADQIEAHGLTPPARIQGYQDMANALVKLYINFVLTDSEVKKARQRLLRQIVNELGKKNG